MHGCCFRYKITFPLPARQQTQNGLARLKNYLSGSPPLLQHGFCRVRGNHLLPGDNGRPGRRGLEIGRANKTERKWQALSQNRQHLPAYLQQVCRLNINIPSDSSWLLCVCAHVCFHPLCVFAHTLVFSSVCMHVSACARPCVCVCFLSNLDHFQVRIVSELSWYAVSVMALTKNLSFLFFSFFPGALKLWQMDCLSAEEIFPVVCLCFG